MKLKGLLTLLALLCVVDFCYSQQSDSLKSYTTQRISGAPPKIDGNLNDPAWDQVPWGGGDFVQRSPNDGTEPTVQTKFKILYDDKNLYVAFKNLDSETDKIVSRMSRRDGFDGDWIEINIDSYNDKRTAFSFTSSVSGVKGDEYISNNGDNWDSNWDPIWYLRTSVVSDGWIAELRIPLSQLRFADKPEHTWGIQFTRRFFRNEERSNWQPVSQNASGWVHRFAELRGIKGIKPQKQLEIQPYVVTKMERFEREEDNPFVTGRSSSTEFGLDAKIGLTSDITLDLTVNPDFGQVEADPSQVNLSAFQLFFPEQRPFFIEGNNILNFNLTGSGNNNLFYSRRIGRRPQGYVNTDNDDLNGDGENDDDGVNENIKSKNNSRILGAAKLTGKNKNGFSWGILESVTALEKVEIDSVGFRRKEAVEPLTNYLVLRAQQDINEGNTVVGGMVTSVNRNIENENLEGLHTNAYSAGLDATHYWKERQYYVSGKVLTSNVRGSTEAITNTQLSSERFFQRPDNNHKNVDTTLTSLTGTGGGIVFGKRGGSWIYDIGYNWSSPELELNDIGFLSRTDQMSQWVWVQYRTLQSFGAFRSFRMNISQRASWDFGGVNTSKNFNMNFNSQLKSFWNFNAGSSFSGGNISNADLRGGPSIAYPGSYNQWFWIGSDSRKKLRVGINPWWFWGFDGYARGNGLWLNLVYRPTNALTIRTSASINNNMNEAQYVTTTSVNDNDRFIVAQIDQTTYNLSIRLTYMVTPNLSVQYWGQPFASTGSYSDFKRVTDPNNSDFNNRFVSFDDNNISFNSEENEYLVDENIDGTTDYNISNPDFNFVQFRSNMVIRWEYIPGSTFFLVWTQNRTDSPSIDNDSFDHLYSGLFNKKPHNIFLMKFTYRFLL